MTLLVARQPLPTPSFKPASRSPATTERLLCHHQCSQDLPGVGVRSPTEAQSGVSFHPFHLQGGLTWVPAGTQGAAAARISRMSLGLFTRRHPFAFLCASPSLREVREVSAPSASCCRTSCGWKAFVGWS